ncbi:MAG: hypothetical protein AAF486_08785 [Pseudomonadota bacterium]
MGELFYSVVLCTALFGGEAEVSSRIDLSGDAGRVRADCITPTHYIEFGLDGSASVRDSVHQAIFGADLNGLRPMVVIIDRDGVEDTHQYEVERVAHLTGTEFRVIHVNTALRVAMTRHFRTARAEIAGS